MNRFHFLSIFRILSKVGLSKYPGLKDMLVELYTSDVESPYLMATLIDIYEEELESGEAEPRTMDKVAEVGTELTKSDCILHYRNF